MEKPDFEKSAEEVNQMETVPPVSIEISLLQVLSTITLIQAGILQHPGIADNEWGKIGIAAAQQLQEYLFKQYPETYKVLEFGWNPGAYITPEDIAAMLLDIDSRSEQNKISEKDCETGCGDSISKQIAPAILESQG